MDYSNNLSDPVSSIGLAGICKGMVPTGVRSVDFKIPSDEIHSFGIGFLESIMSKTPLLAESFILKLIRAFIAVITVELLIKDVKSAFVDLNFGLDF